MTISTESTRVEYTGDGATLPFAVPFKFLVKTDIVVVLRTILTGVDAVQTLYTHYTVTGAGDASGTVTFVTAPPSTQRVVIYNDPPLTQLVDYIAGGTFPAETHEEALDRLTIQQKRTREITTRAILLPDADTDGSGAYDAKSNRIKNLSPPTATTDAASKVYVDSTVSTTIGPIPTSDAYVTATGSITSRKLADRWAEIKNVKDFGAVGDGVTDDTAALVATAAASAAAPGSTVVFAPGTYMWDGTTLAFGDNFNLQGHGATIKMIAGTYSGYTYAISSRIPPTPLGYDAGLTQHNDIRISGLTIDGNYSNVTMTTGSLCGIYLESCTNVTIEDVTVFDCAGADGSLPGVDIFYCTDVHIRGHKSYNTDRQNIQFWESTGSLIDSTLGLSRYRDCLIASSASPTPDFQGSKLDVTSVNMDNTGTTAGTHVVRYSGHSDGVIRSCNITGDGGLDGVYLTDVGAHILLVEDNYISGCEYGFLIESTTNGRKVTSFNNRYTNCTNGIRWNAGGSDNVFSSISDRITGATAQSFYISTCNDVHITNLNASGGTSPVSILTFNTLNINGMNIQGHTDASYALNVSSATQTALPNISGVVMLSNTSDAMSLAYGANVQGTTGTQAGAGPYLTRLGTGYLWRDGTGDLRINYGVPATDTSGVAVGTQFAAIAIVTLDNTGTPTVSGGNVFITGGVATITDFDDGVLGQTITVLSEHAVTITDGTNIILNGSANFVMAASDSLTLVLKADNKWYETARMVN